MRASAKAMPRMARRNGSEACRRPPRRRRGRRACSRNSLRSSAGRSRSPATCCACSSAAGGKRARSATLPARKTPAGRKTNWANGASARCCGPTLSSWACKRRACSIRCCRFRALTTSRAIIAAAAAPPATWSMPKTARRHTPARMRGSATLVRRRPPTPRSPPMNPDTRFGTRLRARSLRASAWSATSIPAPIWWPPTSATPGGTTRWMASSCIPSSSGVPPPRIATRHFCGIRKARRCAGCGPTRSSWNRWAARNSIGRFSRPSSPTSIATAGSFARCTSATAKATCSTPKAASSPRATRKSSKRPCICRTSICRRGCTASTATSRRIATATANFMASLAPRSRWIAPVATAPSSGAPPSSPRGRQPLRTEHASSGCARRGSNDGSPGARGGSTSARWSSPTANGKSCRCWTPSRPETRTTARSRASRKRSSTTSCFGCHLAMTANQRQPMLHNEGLTTRNWTSYNFQVLRDDIYMLGIDGSVTGHRVAPARSSCAILVSSQNQNREWLYYTQQTVSAEGFSGQAFSTFVPHTVRAKETKTCTDCHVSQARDNNAWMAQVLLQGTNFLNFLGRYIYVATGEKGFEAVAVAEHDEPPAVIGSDLQRLAYPDNYSKHLARNRELRDAYHHPGSALDVLLRGEYLYAALGRGGFRVYDVANIDNKGFSERIVTAPVSPLGQRLYLKTRFATAVAAPTTLAVDPLRTRRPENEEQPIHPMYGFLYVADKYEGLVVVGDPNLKGKSPGVGTLLDGDPRNNFLKRAATFNPDGILNGARRITIAGTYAYILCDRGLVVVDLGNPLQPRVAAEMGAPELVEPQGIAVQFRYAFVVDRRGLKVLDVTSLARPRLVPGALVPLEDARNLYVARTYAYVAGGKQGLVIVDVERPEQPHLDQIITGEGKINDARDVKIGIVNASVFAYVADGHNGLQVLQIISPQDSPNHYGFSPRPTPKLIASYHTHGPALAISKGTDRDRAVDESGNQLAVFGRRGARPFNREEMERLYLRDGKLYTVSDQPPTHSPAKGVAWLTVAPVPRKSSESLYLPLTGFCLFQSW